MRATNITNATLNHLPISFQSDKIIFICSLIVALDAFKTNTAMDSVCARYKAIAITDGGISAAVFAFVLFLETN